MSVPPFAVVSILSAALSFAVMGALTHALGSRCDWLTIALVRAVFMFGSSAVVALASGAELVVWRPKTLWVRSLSGTLSLVGAFYALTRLPLGDVLTLTNTYPLWIVVLSWIGLRRLPPSGDIVRVLCGVAGVALIGRPHLESGDRFAAVVALTAAVFAAVAMLGLHRLRGVDARAVVAHFAGVASLILGAWYLVRGPASGGLSRFGPHAVPSAETLWMLLGVAISGTVGQLFLTRAYASGPPTRISVLALTQVVFGLGLDVAIWQRSLPISSFVGTLLVLGPSAWLLWHGASAPLNPHEDP